VLYKLIKEASEAEPNRDPNVIFDYFLAQTPNLIQKMASFKPMQLYKSPTTHL